MHRTTPHTSRLLWLMLAVALWAAPNARAATLLAVTDLHFDPFADARVAPLLAHTPAEGWADVLAAGSPALPGYGDPGTQPLLDGLVLGMRAAAGSHRQPDAILCTGDLLAHDFADRARAVPGVESDADVREMILKTVEYVALRLAGAFPGVPVYLSLGNNDAFAGDYALVDGGAFLARTAPLLARLLPPGVERQAARGAWTRHGCYAADVPGGVTIVSLAGVFLSARREDGTSAARQLDFLERQLQRARLRGRRVWLLTHIPPGVDVFGTLHARDGDAAGPHLFLRPEANRRLNALLREGADVLALTLTGHTHMEDFRLQGAAEGPAESVLHIVPAVSPVFNQNPAFRVFTTDDAGRLADAVTHVLDLETPNDGWRPGPGLRAADGPVLADGPDASGLAALWRAMPDDAALRETYTLRYSTRREPPLMHGHWREFRCGVAASDAEAYAACLR